MFLKSGLIISYLLLSISLIFIFFSSLFKINLNNMHLDFIVEIKFFLISWTKIKKTLYKELLRKNILIKKKYNFFKIEILNISQACKVMIDSIYKNKGYIYPEYER